ncbi:DNA mismatch repair endonuclease MutL [Serratia symbiotica]|uniref:DNA mismatch repair endonuclease MutL n=1 Tax=Serratia symbiotica TaxID=138074 RepID=UPI0030D29763|nr:DNA mismatch repair endonuclease MutL [Serratia symbiotica]
MPIQVLPQQLANQIAAGEVVERPASVVKELVENSLDAGATCIDIDIERGGAKLIRIRDNGCGIGKDDLALALARHATSKISTLDDLEAIVSLGFRGEALASISSVSRLSLTSRTAEQSEAWQAYVEGCDQTVTVKPAAHPVGSTLAVLDLFYNTPARRKFMRTEKTEFGHIDEVVRRIALARFDVAINLSHNGKLIRQYRAAKEKNQHERRLSSICGLAFLQHALNLSLQHGELSICGWVADPAGARQMGEIQYCYVNSRMMRDRLINHAIRQAYQDQLKDNQQPAYVLHLEVDPHQVDVNVHPAKHEVRFNQARLVHDFIYQAVTRVLQQASSALLPEELTEKETPIWQPENRIAAGGNHFSQPTPCCEKMPSSPPASARGRSPQPAYHSGRGYQKREGELYGKLLQAAKPQDEMPKQPLFPPVKSAQEALPASHSHSFGRVMMIHPPCYALIDWQNQLALLNLLVAERWLRQTQLNLPEEGLRSQPLLVPIKLVLNKNEATAIVRHQALLVKMGLDLQADHGHVMLRALPLPLRQQNLQTLIPELLGYLAEHQEMSPTMLAIWLAQHLGSEHQQWNSSQAIQLLTDVERLCPQLVKSPPSGLLQLVDLQAALAALKHE